MKNTFYLNDDRFMQYSFYCAHSQTKLNFKKVIHRYLSFALNKWHLNKKMSGLVFFASTNREDHLKFIKSIYDSFTGNKSFCVPYKKRGLNIKFLWLYALNIFSKKKIKFLKLYDETTENGYTLHKCTLYERNWIYLDYVNCLYFDALLSKIDIKNSNGCVVLYDTCQPERNLVNLFNKFNLPSITLCHGIFNPHIDYRQESFLNYWKSDASFALTWGSGTSFLFNKYSPKTKTIVCGNPLIKKECFDEDCQYIGIVLSVGSLRLENQKMIEILESFSVLNHFKIHLRIHPGDNAANYKINNDVSCFERNLDSDYFIVCHTSAMLYLYMAQGKKVLKFIGNTPTYSTNPNISFNSLNDLEAIYEKIHKINFEKISKEEIEIIGEESKRIYSSTLAKIITLGKDNEHE